MSGGRHRFCPSHGHSNQESGTETSEVCFFSPGIWVTHLTLFLETMGLRVRDTNDRQEFTPGGQRRPVCVWAGAAGVDLLARQAGVAHGKMGGRG